MVSLSLSGRSLLEASQCSGAVPTRVVERLGDSRRKKNPKPKPGVSVPPQFEFTKGALGTAGGENALADGSAAAAYKRLVLHHP